MSDEQKPCADFDETLIRYVDGEATEAEVERLRSHLARCARCREELRAHQKLRDLARDLWPAQPPEELWDEYVQGVYDRMERGLGWVLTVVGAAVLAAVGVWRYVTGFLLRSGVGWPLKVGLTALILGLVLLLVSVYRQRRREARSDRYREVIR